MGPSHRDFILYPVNFWHLTDCCHSALIQTLFLDAHALAQRRYGLMRPTGIFVAQYLPGAMANPTTHLPTSPVILCFQYFMKRNEIDTLWHIHFVLCTPKTKNL